MPFYHQLGSVPRKRHVQFRSPSGNLYQEELVDDRHIPLMTGFQLEIQDLE